MKRLLLAALIGTATLVSFSSCKKEYINNPLPGVTYKFSVPGDDYQWKTEGNPRTFVISVPFREIDAKYFDYGQVSVAISFKDSPDFYINLGANNVPTKLGPYNFRVEYSFTDGNIDGDLNIYADYLGTGTATPPPPFTAKVTLTDGEDGGN
ncbi:hypothetical protein ACR78Z_11970 [Sphingobacterium thalpophilum]|uniref:DUF4843 domain-containing protein n=1 Tax=Sphingobacterium thalpophilum TaxID=259 RepID=A0A4U9VHP3_9SPHI|nr:hypothetical protein [Sphingobacterium thalpophilum]VTR44882.1 Uncharacterised protein [Sphingobacterium thalpophilum]